MNDIPRTGSDLLPVTEARRLLLEPAGLDDAHLSHVLASIHTHEVDFADLYFQYSRTESWSLEEGIVKSGAFAIDRGVGIRAVRGEKQAFAYSDDISLLALDEAATAARAIGRQGQSAHSQIARVGDSRALYVPARSRPLPIRGFEGGVARASRADGESARSACHAGDGIARR